jgi:hypothetical protein
VKKLGVFLVLVACGHAPAKPAQHVEGDIPDSTDKCPWVEDACPSGDADGCPDVAIELDADCRLPPKNDTLRHIADDLVHKPRIGLVRISASSDACGAAVASALEHEGVAPNRLEVRSVGGEPRAYLEVIVWNGARCR